MNKFYIASGFLIIILYISFFRDTTKIVNYPSAGTAIVAFGDSLVEGVGSTKGNDFVSLLSDTTGQSIQNLGVSGDTTRDGLARVDEVLNLKPKIVLLLLGGNDYIKKIPKEETFSNLEKIITEIQEEGSIVILLGVRGGVLKDEYKNEFKALAKETGSAYVPNVLDGLLGYPSLMHDSIHPNNDGYKIIAEKIYPVIIELLE
ncbi:arylesterase [Candidatus Nomurabacteria bacterium]|nr:arylesterase [Candidatus Nomurabacteria bacterium]